MSLFHAMESDQETVPSAKRRKLNASDGDQLLVGSSPYLTLASASVSVNVVSLDTRANSTDVVSNSVSISSISSKLGQCSILVSAPWLKTSATLTADHSSEIFQIIQDCTQLPSSLKASNDYQASLACHDAKLCLDTNSARLVVKILWHDTGDARDRVDPLLLEILMRYDHGVSPSPPSYVPQRWDVSEFYSNVHVPEASADVKINTGLLQCELYPFQRRAVKWLLSREGVDLDKSGMLFSKDDDPDLLPSGFHETTDAIGTVCYMNPSIGVACSRREGIDMYNSIRGGLLGEAMGLGKTVEMVALMCLHSIDKSPHAPSPTHLKRSGATLIITPLTILDQWKQEIQIHAPSLRVYHYEGMKAGSKKTRSALFENLCGHDVVLTTYNVIAKELHYVMERPDRALRNRPRFDPPKSPLDQILWWRVCLDEAQMIESGVSAAARVARLVPRVNAWAVTGTPIKQSHRDLYGLLLFLRYEPWCNSTRRWDFLVSYNRPMFRRLMGEIAIRHSKELVRDELRLPPQSRHTISIAFTNIEQAHYAQLFYDMYQDVGLNNDGSPLDDQWNPDSPKNIEKMRTWLTRLRQTCLHPEVGGRNKKALGRSNGPLRTVAQVLDVMIDQAETTLRAEQRNMLMHKVRQGQILENAKDRKQALKIYTEAYDEAGCAVDVCRQALKTELALHKDEKLEDDAGDTEGDSPLAKARQRLRWALEVQHVCIFFMGNIYFQLKEGENDDDLTALERRETEAYDEAKKIRAELLQEVVRKANERTSKITSDKDGGLVSIPQMGLDLDYSGIESRKIFEKLYKFCGSMNEQSVQFEQLRRTMVNFLQQALIDEDEGTELKGDEYENSTKHQDEMYAHMEALRALFADRSDAISGQENLLIRNEMKGFLRAAKSGEGPAPEVMIKLLAEREQKRINISEQGSLRGIVAELRALVSSLEWAATNSSRPRSEMHVAEQILQHATKLMTAQNKALTGLEQEVAYFRNSMNARLEYYKALQKISDTVAPYREEDVKKKLDEVQLQKYSQEETSARKKYSMALAKSKYLLHLKAESTSEAERICTICQSTFDTGTITSCGHVFCKDDIQLWYRDHGNCPVCKQRLRAADFCDITYKPSEMVVQGEVASPESVHSDKATLSNSIYSDISGRQLDQIKNIELRGASFGSKVDTICRHIHWLREKDSGSKTLVFSQFREVLDVLGRAFRQNGITYSKCDDKGAIQDFKSNPAIEAFLLHARAHSAGLNLVVASHVILCEPLINTALELQAIARVHRIGQHRSTTVWMYLIADTVEESIYDISVKRRLAHINTKESRSGIQTPEVLQESTIDAANSKELQAADLSKALAPGKNGGEMVDKDDLWPCLFGNAGDGKNHGFLDAPADAVDAGSEIGRFLRMDAVVRRRNV